MKEKILQIIPAPEGMDALVQHCTYDLYNDNDITWETDDYGFPVYDYYSVVCLALVKSEDGEQSVVPMIYDTYNPYEGCYSQEPRLATEWDHYMGVEMGPGESDDQQEKTITLQYNMGKISIHEDPSYFIVGTDDGKFTIFLIVNGRDMAVGVYNSKRAAQIAWERMEDDSAREVKMISATEADERVKLENQQKEQARIITYFETFFTWYQASTLAGAGYTTMEELKNVSDEELKSKKVNFIKTIRKQVDKWSNH